MAISFTRPDPSSPSSVASASFTTARKGFEPSEVREFLRMVAAELARLQERERFLERELRTAQRNTAPSSVALDEELVTKMLGEEAARILHTSRDAASQIKQRAEEGAARLLREATDEAQRLREEAEIEAARRRADATADAESELEMAKQQGREMVNEARAYRERVLNELARRREIARQQIEQLVHGRDRLLQAFERSRLVAVDVMAELTPLGEPNEYVNLSPTTGPVPLMVPNMPRPGTEPVAAAPAPVVERPADTDDPTIALTVSPVVPLVETERPAPSVTTDASATAAAVESTDAADADAADATDATDATEEPDTTVSIFVDTDLEAERAAEQARRDEALARETEAAAARRPVEPITVETVEIEIEIVDELDSDAEATDEQDEQDDTVVQLGIAPSSWPSHDDREHDDHDDRVPAPVVNLFGNERSARSAEADLDTDDTLDTLDTEAAADAEIDGDGTAETDADAVDVAEAPIDAVEIDDVEAEDVVEQLAQQPDEHIEQLEEAPDPDATVALSRTSADDLFARLRAARAESVAQRAAAATQPARPVEAEPAPARVEPAPTAVVEDRSAPAVFQRSAEAPQVAADAADTPFARRDEALTPLIVAAARKLKRVLADEQNEVLHALRRKEPVRALDVMLTDERTQGERYAAAIAAELVAAATAGAASMGADATTAARAVERERATAGATKLLVSEIVSPLRERLARCVGDADGDNTELASLVRLVYREWKNQRIDEQLDDIARTAFGRGALAGVSPGTPICWLVDPNGPECADAEDNALGGAVPAGEGFPTDHPCAPAHNGCRCMIARVD